MVSFQGLNFCLLMPCSFSPLPFAFIIISMGILYCFSSQAVRYFTKTDVLEISDLLKLAVFIPLTLSIYIPLKQLLLGFNQQQLYIRIVMIMVLVK